MGDAKPVVDNISNFYNQGDREEKNVSDFWDRWHSKFRKIFEETFFAIAYASLRKSTDFLMDEIK